MADAPNHSHYLENQRKGLIEALAAFPSLFLRILLPAHPFMGMLLFFVGLTAKNAYVTCQFIG